MKIFGGNHIGSVASLRLLLAFLVGAPLALWTVPSRAQDWPNRTVKVVVPYGPGGVTDVIARLYVDRLSKAYSHAFVIENRGGAGGAIGTEYAARSANDGYTIYCAGGAPLTILPQMQKLSFDPVRDLAPVAMITVNSMALTVHPDLPVHSLAEFVAYVKAHPGEINYSIGGVGTMSHLSPALLSARYGLNMVAVPYQSMPPAITALMSGTVQMFFGNISDIIEPIRTGKVRLLAVSTEKRSPEFPDVPTIAESIPGFVLIGWNAFFAPVGTPRPIVDSLSNTLIKISHDAEIMKTLANIGIDTINGSAEDLANAIQADISLYKTALDATDLLRKEVAK
jgi:tripartite-type tricarboxylate transporter receptor subunit TctC